MGIWKNILLASTGITFFEMPSSRLCLDSLLVGVRYIGYNNVF
jgi:hypothetical protein